MNVGRCRNVAYIVATAIFIFQMQQAIRKYLDWPIVEKKSSTTLDKIQKVRFCCFI